jgi:hypothetical protein
VTRESLRLLSGQAFGIKVPYNDGNLQGVVGVIACLRQSFVTWAMFEIIGAGEVAENKEMKSARQQPIPRIRSLNDASAHRYVIGSC